MSKVPTAMEPYFFGRPGRELFGAFHPARGAAVERHGVVICYPFGHEYVNCLRGCRQLATRLSRVGFDVLRFDYQGTGDSAGSGEEVSLDDWIDDIEQAIADIQRRASFASLTLIGIRLGASLASLVGARRPDVPSLVLWAPVTVGKTYVVELRQRHRAFLRSEDEAGRDQDDLSSDDEVMGFPLPETLAVDLEAMDLLQLPRRPASHVLLIDDRASPSELDFDQHLRNLGASVEHRHLTHHAIWVREPGQERALVPVPVLEAIVSWTGVRASGLASGI